MPLELRSRIYEYLWDETTLERTYHLMEASLTGRYCGEYWKQLKVTEHPHYIIENKRGFKLNIKLRQETVRLDIWPLALELFEPALTTFKKEGADVRIYWAYQHSDSPKLKPLEIELDSVVENLSLDWKTDVISQLDKVSWTSALLYAYTQLIAVQFRAESSSSL
jgi:hypothetical protein